MCLTIRPQFPKPKAPITVYKWYEGQHFAGFPPNPDRNVVFSAYRSVKYEMRKNRFIRSDRVSAKVSTLETCEKQIFKGLHAYLNKRIAQEELRHSDNRKTARIAKFLGYPEDFVAGGSFGARKSVVFTKLKFIEWVK